jgi:hypothetical protein
MERTALVEALAWAFLAGATVGLVAWFWWSHPRRNRSLQSAEVRFLHGWELGWGLLVIPAGLLPLYPLTDRLVHPLLPLATLALVGYLVAVLAVVLGCVLHTLGRRVGVNTVLGAIFLMMVTGGTLAWVFALPNYMLPWLIAQQALNAGFRLDTHERRTGSSGGNAPAIGKPGGILG